MEKQQSAINAKFITKNSGCQTMIGADSAEGNDAGGFFPFCFSQDEFELSDLVAAVDVRAEIVTLDPKVCMSDSIKPLDGRRKTPQGYQGDALFQFRI